MSDKKIAVILDTSLSTPYQKRYIVIDKETGEVMDNAQSYGYKSIKNAYASYSYKTRDKSKDKEKAGKTKQIQKWLDTHEDFTEALEVYAFEIAKGSWGPDAKLDAKLVKDLLKNSALETSFTASEILNVWRKRH